MGAALASPDGCVGNGIKFVPPGGGGVQSFGEWVAKRRWTLFIGGLVVAWLVLFVVDMATTYDALAVDDTMRE